MSGALQSPQARRWLYLWALVVAPLLYGAAFPRWKLAWAAWIGLIPWCVALRVARTRTALSIACASTLLGSYVCTTWLPSAVANYYQQPLAVGLLLFAGVYAITVGPYVVAFTLCYRWLARRPSAWLPLLVGAAWAASEVGRVRLLAGNPFGLFGYSQVDLTPLVQVADVTGVFAVSGILIAVNAALAELWLAYRGEPHAVDDLRVCTPPQAWWGAGLVAAALVGMTGYGLARMRAFDGGREGAATPIAIVQANLDAGSQWRRELYGVNFEAYVQLTARALRSAPARVVFWPESAMTFFLDDVPAYRAALAALLAPAGAELVAGGPRAGGDGVRYYNAVFLVAPDGDVVARYDKQRLLPFAEHFPFGGSALLRRQFARVREFTPGGPSAPLPTAAGAAGVLICNEAMFGEIAAERAGAGAGYLATLTNDSWLGDRKFAEQALDMARLRAIEQRRYLVRASTSGPSAIVDPLGRVQARTDADTAATITGTIHAATGLTLYARYGDLFGALCVALLACAAVRRLATAERAPSGRRRGA